MRTSAEQYLNSSGLIDKKIGDLYELLETVRDNLSTYRHISFYMENLFDIHNNLTDLIKLSTQDDALNFTNDNITDLTTYFNNLNTLITNRDSLDALATEIEENANLAQKWSNAAEDVEVNSGLFSALHYAAKAALTLTQTQLIKTDVENLKTATENSVQNLVDNAGNFASESETFKNQAEEAAIAAIRAETLLEQYLTISDFVSSDDDMDVGTILRIDGSRYEVIDPLSENFYHVSSSGVKIRPISYHIDFDNDRGNLVVNPDFPERTNNIGYIPPQSVPYYNVIMTVDGVPNDAVIWRSNLYGTGVGSRAEIFERVDAFGDGAMRFSNLSQRNTAFGSLALQWIGFKPQSGEDLSTVFHDFWHPVLPTDPNWNFDNLENNNPGIKDQIANPNYAATTDEVKENVALGRDAVLHLIKGERNTGIGKNALAHLYEGSRNTAVGYGALEDNLYGTGDTAIGYLAGARKQEGINNTFVGRGSGALFVNANYNVTLGFENGINITSGDDNVIIGSEAGSDLTGAVSDRLSIGSRTRDNLISGNFLTGTLGINVPSGEIKGQGLHVRISDTGGLVNSAADGLIVEQSGTSTGITILTDNDQFGQLLFADSDDNNVGGIWYNHTDDTFQIRAGNGVRLVVHGNGEIETPNLPTSAPSGSNRLWNDGGTVKIT